MIRIGLKVLTMLIGLFLALSGIGAAVISIVSLSEMVGWRHHLELLLQGLVGLLLIWGGVIVFSPIGVQHRFLRGMLWALSGLSIAYGAHHAVINSDTYVLAWVLLANVMPMLALVVMLQDRFVGD